MIYHIVGVSGSLTIPSRTSVLVEALARRLALALAPDGSGGATVEILELSTLGSQLFSGPSRNDLGPDVIRALSTIEAADILVVGSPAYRATYSGVFKHIFDYVGQHALADKPILLTATGGSERDALLVEHQMRPLFAFFQALTLPYGVYATEKDIVDYSITSPELLERIARTAERAGAMIRSYVPMSVASASGVGST